MTEALQVKGLRKSYGKKEVLKGIDFCVRSGDGPYLLPDS